MPAESEYASAWLDTTKTGYIVSDNNVTAAGLVNFRVSYALKENLAAYELSNRELHLTLPEGLQVYRESVRENGKSAEDYDLSGNELVVYVTGNSGTVQFSASPTVYGKIESQATLTFSYEGTSYEEFVGYISNDETKELVGRKIEWGDFKGCQNPCIYTNFLKTKSLADAPEDDEKMTGEERVELNGSAS